MMIAKLMGLVVMTAIAGNGNQINNQKDSSSSEKQKPTQVLLIGTFHFHNPGRDIVKTKSFDVLTESAQNDLEDITSKIAAFAPSKVFVEYNYEKQEKLDGLYARYLAGTFFDDPNLSKFYRRNEIFQFGFRVAKKLGLKKVYAVDYRNTDFPYYDVMKVIDSAKQDDLKSKIDSLTKKFATDMNMKIDSGASLKELLYWMNSKESKDENVEYYTELLTRAGDRANFQGAKLVSEWYRRNFYIWSLIQKQTTKNDDRILILFGSGHTAVLDQILKYNRNWKTVGLKEIMEN